MLLVVKDVICKFVIIAARKAVGTIFENDGAVAVCSSLWVVCKVVGDRKLPKLRFEIL